jgi:hypothetical protein
MNADLIIDRLMEMSGGVKKSKSKKKALEDVDVKYVNQYKNGEEGHEGARYKVAQILARMLLGRTEQETVSVQEVGIVPEKLINQAMKKLAKARDIEIDEELEKDKKSFELIDKAEKLHRKNYLQNALTKVKAAQVNYNDVMYPDLKEMRANIKEDQPLGKIKPTAPLNADELKLANSLQGLGRRKRAPSKYNKFIGEYMRKHKGSSLSEAAQAWHKSK